MIALCRLAVTTALALGLLAGCEEEPQPAQGRENLREVKPPAGPQYTGEICPVVRNRAPLTLTGRILMQSRERVTFRLARNDTRRLCPSGTTYGNGPVSLVLPHSVPNPPFNCNTN